MVLYFYIYHCNFVLQSRESGFPVSRINIYFRVDKRQTLFLNNRVEVHKKNNKISEKEKLCRVHLSSVRQHETLCFFKKPAMLAPSPK